ncbi:MAG: YsnF/AvaK domain-containing protein [Sphingobacteriaceae bacterium]|nr:YsnF/AvaK domain-containing protein [Sphingobacteriaceae bacterium]
MCNNKTDPTDKPQSAEYQVEKLIVPVMEEQLTIDKKEIETGKVTVSKKVHSEQQVIDIPVVEEEVDVQRIPFNQYIQNTPPAVRYEGEKTIIPILKEVLVVEKKLVLVEEVHITRKQKHSNVSQQETLKQEEVIVSRVDLNSASI